MIKDMNISLIFRGQLNYPFQLIFSFAGCASYGSFNVSSVCVLIAPLQRPGSQQAVENKKHIQQGLLPFSFLF